MVSENSKYLIVVQIQNLPPAARRRSPSYAGIFVEDDRILVIYSWFDAVKTSVCLVQWLTARAKHCIREISLVHNVICALWRHHLERLSLLDD